MGWPLYCVSLLNCAGTPEVIPVTRAMVPTADPCPWEAASSWGIRAQNVQVRQTRPRLNRRPDLRNVGFAYKPPERAEFWHWTADYHARGPRAPMY